MTKRYILTLIGLWCVLAGAGAQEFFDLTADEVRIDSTLPRFTHTVELGAQYADDYDVSIEYPEFIDMSATDVARYHRLRRDTVPAMPVIDRYVGVARRQGTLYLSFTPIHCSGCRLCEGNRPTRPATPLTPFCPRADGQRSAWQRRVSISSLPRWFAVPDSAV